MEEDTFLVWASELESVSLKFEDSLRVKDLFFFRGKRVLVTDLIGLAVGGWRFFRGRAVAEFPVVGKFSRFGFFRVRDVGSEFRFCIHDFGLCVWMVFGISTCAGF